MSAGRPIPLTEASAVAGELVAALAPGCARIAIAGSIRRQPWVDPAERSVDRVDVQASLAVPA